MRVIVPNFAQIGKLVVEIWRFDSFFKTAAATILDFLDFENLMADKVRHANLRHLVKISSKSVNQLQRNLDTFDFVDGNGSHLRF